MNTRNKCHTHLIGIYFITGKFASATLGVDGTVGAMQKAQNWL